MSIEQRHFAIRETLAAIGYHVRDERGKPLQIVTQHPVERALFPKFCVRLHDDFPLFIESNRVAA